MPLFAPTGSALCFDVSANAYTCGEISFDEYLDRMLAHLTGTQHAEDIPGLRNERMMFDPLSMAIQGCLFTPNFTFLEGMDEFIIFYALMERVSPNMLIIEVAELSDKHTETGPPNITNTSHLKIFLINSWNGLMSDVEADAPFVLESLKAHEISRNILEAFFCIACIRENPSLLEYCFSLANDLSDLREICKQRSIFLAARDSPNFDTWQLLLANGFLVDRGKQDQSGNFHDLATVARIGDRPHFKLLKLLVQHGLQISDDIFALAAKKFDEEGMQWLVSKCEVRDMNQYALITAAASNGRVVEVLIDSGMNVNFEVGRSSDPFDGRPGTFPLLEAASVGNLNVVKLLLERGAEKEKKNSDGWSAAKIAAQNGHTDVLNFIESFVSGDSSL